MKKYLEDLKTALNETGRFRSEEIADILADHQEMIDEALRAGLPEADLASKFGDPAKVAADLAEGCGSKSEPTSSVESDTAALFTMVPPQEPIGIAIRLATDDVVITAEARADIVVRGDEGIVPNRYEIVFADGTLSIQLRKRDVCGWIHGRSGAFDIRVPKTLKIGEFQLQTASGDYRIAGIRADRVKVNAASGDGAVTDASVDHLEIAAVNGDLQLSRLIVAGIDVTLVSGDIAITHVVCDGDIRLTSTSGDIEIEDSTCAEASVHTVSGDLDGTDFYPESVSLTSVSGDVVITNSDRNRPIRIRHSKSISGDIRINER